MGDHGKPWQYCTVPVCDQPTVKVLDFSLDVDQERDSSGTYTHASLKKEAIPLDFTICSAFMVEDWTTEYQSGVSVWSVLLFLLRGDDGGICMYVCMYVCCQK